MGLGERIKEARLRNGYTQEALAALVGVSKGSIGNYEVGISSPNEDTLIKLMKILDTDANFLYQDYIPPDLGGVSRSKEKNDFIRLIDSLPDDLVTQLLQIAHQIIEMREK